MDNKKQPDMQSIISLVKFLVDAWRGSKCTESAEPAYCCAKCKYKEICAKIEELAKVVNK